MIPQSFRDILSNGENAGLYQTLAMLIFLIFFLGIIFYVFSRPKRYYDEEEHAPLSDDHIDEQAEEKKL